jgi:hypothetical protein
MKALAIGSVALLLPMNTPTVSTPSCSIREGNPF